MKTIDIKRIMKCKVTNQRDIVDISCKEQFFTENCGYIELHLTKYVLYTTRCRYYKNICSISLRINSPINCKALRSASCNLTLFKLDRVALFVQNGPNQC